MGAVGAKPSAAPGSEFPWTETWTGTNGDPWNASKWADRTASSAGVIDIQANAGRLAPGGAAYAYARGRASAGDLANIDVLIAVTRDSNSEAYFSVFARASTTWDSNNLGVPNDGYRVQLDLPGSGAMGIIKTTAGTDSSLGSVNIGTTVTKRWVRLQCTGTTIRVRTWLDGDAEPGTWNISATDATHTTGKFGVSHYNGGTTTTRTATLDDLTVTAL